MTTVSDDFNRSDGALGANWTVHQGAADVNTNRMRVQTDSFTNVIATHATSLGGTDQYIKLVFGSAAGVNTFPLAIFRFTDSSSPFYGVYIDQDDGNIDLYRFDSVGGGNTLVGSSGVLGFGFGDGVSIGLTLSGTGASTVLRAWHTVTADAPTDASTWDGGAADGTISDDPASPVDSGNIVGCGGSQSAANSTFFDAFFAGDIGGAPLVQAIGQVSETDSVQALAGAKSKAVGLLAETDEGQAFVVNGSTVFLDAAHDRQLIDEDGDPWDSVLGWEYAWYDDPDDLLSGGTPAASGTFDTDAGANVRIEVPATTLAAGQSGALVVRHPDYPSTPIHALLLVPIGP